MKTVTANTAKQSFGKILQDAQTGPVLIQKHQRPAAVMMSVKDYERLQGLNRAEFSEFCRHIGERAASKGLTETKLQELLDDQE